MGKSESMANSKSKLHEVLRENFVSSITTIGTILSLLVLLIVPGPLFAITFDDCKEAINQGIQSDSSINTPPIFNNISDHNVIFGEAVSLRIDVCDVERMVPGAIADNLPVGATLDDNGDGTRTLNWIPSIAEERDIVFTAYDEMDANVTSQLKVHFFVSDPADSNRPPVIEPLPKLTVEAGQTVVQRIVPTDPYGGVPALYSNGLPVGASLFDNFDGTRTFVWTTSTSDVGSVV